MTRLASVIKWGFSRQATHRFHLAQGTEVTDVLFCDYLTFRLETTAQQNRVIKRENGFDR
jgi:hypothetical protein